MKYATFEQFILKNVSNNFVSGYGVLKNPLSPPSGVKNALVFKNICNKCDNTKFQQYENISIYDKEEIPVEVLREISLKDYLFMSHKRRFEWIFLKEKTII